MQEEVPAWDDPLDDREWPDEVDDDEPSWVTCPECGADVYDDLEQCPSCGQYIILSTNPWQGRSTAWLVVGLLGMAALILAWIWPG